MDNQKIKNYTCCGGYSMMPGTCGQERTMKHMRDMKCKCDKCGRETDGSKWGGDRRNPIRLLVLCPECEAKFKKFVRDLAVKYGIGTEVQTGGSENAAD